MKRPSVVMVGMLLALASAQPQVRAQPALADRA